MSDEALHLPHQDFYTLLGVSRTATQEEIKKGYMRLARTYHPDKQGEENKKEASEKLLELSKAYEILSDPIQRSIYDTYGIEGIQCGWEIIKNSSGSTEEMWQSVRDILAKTKNESLTGNCTASTNLALDQRFSQWWEERHQEQSNRDQMSFWETLKCTRIYPTQVFQETRIPLSTTTTATLQSSIGGEEKDSLSVGLSRNFEKLFIGVINLTGTEDGIGATLDCFAPINSVLNLAPLRLNVGPSLDWHVQPTIQSNISNQITAVIVPCISNFHSFCAVSTIYRYSPRASYSVGMQYDLHHTHCSASAKFKPFKGVSLTARLGYSTSPTEMRAYESAIPGVSARVGVMKKVWKGLSVGYEVSASTSLVSLEVLMRYSKNTCRLPFPLVDGFSGSTALSAIFAPIVLGTLVSMLIVNPLQSIQQAREKAEEMEARRKNILLCKHRADMDVSLMRETVERKTERELRVRGGGLIIVKARYGDLTAKGSSDAEYPQQIDVTVPLQFLVEDSKIELKSKESKENIVGFYNPCVDPDAVRQLHVVYRFKNQLHEVTLNDTDEIFIPKRSHRRK